MPKRNNLKIQQCMTSFRVLHVFFVCMARARALDAPAPSFPGTMAMDMSFHESVDWPKDDGDWSRDEAAHATVLCASISPIASVLILFVIVHLSRYRN